MRKRVKKVSTGLYFDSLKHLKNNLSNLVTIELLTLCNSTDLTQYLSLKPVNAKSKLPDMKKVGLIYYNRPSENVFELSEEGLNIYKILKKHKDKFKYPDDLSKNIRAVSSFELIELLSPNDLEIFKYNILKLLLSYFDTADFIRPYLLLIKVIENNGISKLNNDILNNILAQPKLNILNNYIDPLAYEKLEDDLKNELRRPTSYIRNFLQTSLIIDENDNIIYDRGQVESIILELEEIDIESLLDPTPSKKNATRSSTLQREFRTEVLENFNYKCAITGKPIIIERENLDELVILEAAHIIPFSEGGSFSYKNGISLTPELHKLFDLGLFTFKYVDDNTLLVITTTNKNVKDNGILHHISNRRIDLNNLKKGKPDEIAIEYRSKKII